MDNSLTKFQQGYVLYSDVESHEVIMELWGGSTKHCDSIFRFKDFNKVEWIPDEAQYFSWMCEIASKLTLPSHAKSLMRWALATVA